MLSQTPIPFTPPNGGSSVNLRWVAKILHSELEGLPRVFVCLISVAAVLAIGELDVVSGDASVSVLYLIPISLCTWLTGQTLGLAMAFLSAAVTLRADLITRDEPQASLVSLQAGYIPYWNAGMLLILFALLVYLLWSVKTFQGHLTARIERRTAQLSEANAELRATQQKLVETAKLELVGRLAAGVAHEVKNPLMTITMAVDFFAMALPTDDLDGRIMVQDMREAVSRANRVISELLQLSRPSELHRKLEAPEVIIDHALGLVKHSLLEKKISFERQFETCPALWLDKNKIVQVLLNLLMNAIQATPAGGHLVVSLRCPADESVACIEILDSGSGIEEANLGKLFEPFFATKPTGQGTGLGLSVSRQIAKQHGGDLHLDNRTDQRGARAVLRLAKSTPSSS